MHTRVCVCECACFVCLHRPHNHISPHCITADQHSLYHLVLSCLHLVEWKPWSSCNCTFFTLLTFRGGSDKPASRCDTVNTWFHPRTEGGLSQGQMLRAELVSLSCSAEAPVNFASMWCLVQNPSVSFGDVLWIFSDFSPHLSSFLNT